MVDEHIPQSTGVPEIYQFRIEGHIDPRRARLLNDMTLTVDENGESVLTGPVVDQAALFGLLKKVRDLGLPLLSVTRLNQDQSGHPDSHT